MAYSAKAVANYILDVAKKRGFEITDMQLQKIVFFAHAVYFNQHHKPLISDPVMAWKHGPVIPSLYQAFRSFGNRPITTRAVEVEFGDWKDDLTIVEPQIQPDDCETKEFLKDAVERLGKYSAWRLREVSHQKGGAWYETVKKYVEEGKEIPRNLTILDSVIQECGK